MHQVSAQFMEFFLAVIAIIVAVIFAYDHYIKADMSNGNDPHPSRGAGEASGRDSGPDHPQAH